jgi:hypothetical protein
MKGDSLFEPTQIGPLSLNNRLVMSPMTRNRATASNIPPSGPSAEPPVESRMLDNIELKMVMVNVSRCQFHSGGLLYIETNTGEDSA